MKKRNPLVLVPQHFGSLVFDRRTSRYLPFDHESTRLLLALHARGIGQVHASIGDPEERGAVLAFCGCFHDLGFFRLDGTLAADVLDVDIPPDHLVGPLAVHLEIVAACNLSCSHCFAGTLPRNHDPLRVEEMEALFGELAGIGSFRLGLTGGEPLMRKDLFDILDAAGDAGLHPCLTTNGLLLTEDIARELGKREMIWLNVSLEGPDARTNDPVRGAGTFDQVVDKLKLLRDHARFTLAFTITSTNAHLVRECAALAYEVGAHTAVFRPLYPAGTALHHLELMPTFSQYRQALDDLETMNSPGLDLHGLDHFSPQTRAATRPQLHTSATCGAGQHVCSISVQGDVNPCSFLGPGFNGGNIREQPFADIWRTSQQFQRMRRRAEGSGKGFEGGCRARALTYTGSADAPDPWYDEYRNGTGGHHPGVNVEVSACMHDGHLLALPLVSAES